MKVAVLGGGVTGLTAAWKLRQEGHEVRLLESSTRLGGAVRSEAREGWLVECGPNALQETPEVGTLLGELGLGDQRIVAAAEAKNRYIVRKGKLVGLPAPSDVAGLVATPLLSFGSKLKVTSEVARSPQSRTEDVSVAELVREHFGSEILERFVQPLVGGIYAGDAERLSAQYAFPKIWEAERTSGSLVRAGLEASKKRKALGLAPSSMISFRDGLQAIPDALAAHLGEKSVLLNTEAVAMTPSSIGGWRLTWIGEKGEGSGQFDRVVAALPSWSLARLRIGAAGDCPLSGVADIDYPPVASVFLGFAREQVAHPLDGFGALLPASENRSILGVIFSSSLFPGRSPEGHVALTAFVGGVLQADIALLPKKNLVARVMGDLRDLLGVTGEPVFVRHTLWKRAIPQYNLGHGRHLEAFAQCERDHPGLLIGGNSRFGISLPDCILAGAALAERVS